MDYKNTLNLPQTGFPMKADLTTREPQRLQKWRSARLYEAIQTALWLLPGNRDLLDKRITVLVMRGKFDDALRVFNRQTSPAH